MPVDEWGAIEARIDAEREEEKEPEAIEVPGRPVIDEEGDDPPMVEESKDDDPSEEDEDAPSSDIEKMVAERVAKETKALRDNQKTDAEKQLLQMLNDDPQFVHHMMAYFQPGQQGQGSPQQAPANSAPHGDEDPLADLDDEDRDNFRRIASVASKDAIQEVLKAIGPYLQMINSFQPHISNIQNQGEFDALDREWPGWNDVMTREEVIQHRDSMRKALGRDVPAVTAFRLNATKDQMTKLLSKKEGEEPGSTDRRMEETWGRQPSPRRPTRRRPSTESRAPITKQEMFLKAMRDHLKRQGG